jgi:hypothetical protein
MTTPPLPQQPPYPPLTETGRPRSRRALLVIASVLLVLAGAGFASWKLTAGDDVPLAGRPRVSDEAAGISYGIPEGWTRGDQKDLIDAFTSTISHERGEGDGEGGSVVLAGRGAAVPQADLEARTEAWARSNAEFFYPDGSSTVEESRPAEVDGRPAHTVALKVTDGEGGTGHLRLTVVSVDYSRSAFLLGVAQPAGADENRAVDTVLESAAVL